MARVDVEAVDVGSEPATAPPNARSRQGGRAGSALSWLTSQYDKDIFALAVPAALALAADPLLGMVDTALVGRLGSDELVRVSSKHDACSAVCMEGATIYLWYIAAQVDR